MDDLISREKALNTISFLRKCCDTNDIDDYTNMLVEAFQVLPPEQTTKIQDILNYLDAELYKIVPYHIYSELYDMISILSL